MGGAPPPRFPYDRRSIMEALLMRYLLALPFIGLLWLPFYNHELPSLFGFPFFYWYQFAWVPLTALIIWVVYQHGLKQGDE
jgi:hypothetical protein